MSTGVEDGAQPRAVRVGIWGCGLIGTSTALALSASGCQVRLWDADPEQLAVASRVARCRAWRAPEGPDEDGWLPDVVFACVPPRATGAVLAEACRLYRDATVSDTCSVKSQPLGEAETRGADMTRVVGGHPMAGRELSGPLSARADLFQGRAWALTPAPQTAPERLEQVRSLAVAAGGFPVVVTAEEHDRAVALLSHVPQLLASALAAATGALPEAALELAGTGFADTTRLADSPPELWAEIVGVNADQVGRALGWVLAPLLALPIPSLGPLATAGQGWAGEADVPAHVRRLVSAGRAARERLPSKRGRRAAAWAWVAVVLDDRPGQLVRLLGEVAARGVNVEDIRIDHAVHQPTGVVELAVAPPAAERLVAALTEAGWHAGRRS